MAQLTGLDAGVIVKGGPGTGTAVTGSIDDSATIPVGSQARDAAGNVYIYLQGIGSTIAGSVVTYNSLTGVTALIAANAIGTVAVAMAAIVANKFGWYQIFGNNTVVSCDAGVVSGAALYIDGTAGRIDDTVVAGDLVAGMFARSTDASNLCSVYMQYPFVTDTLS